MHLPSVVGRIRLRNLDHSSSGMAVLAILRSKTTFSSRLGRNERRLSHVAFNGKNEKKTNETTSDSIWGPSAAIVSGLIGLSVLNHGDSVVMNENVSSSSNEVFNRLYEHEKRMKISVKGLPVTAVHTSSFAANSPIEDRHAEYVCSGSGQMVENVEGESHDEKLSHDQVPKKGFYALFGVFDGHRGSAAAEYCRVNIFNHITKALAKNIGWLSAIKEGFIHADMEFLDESLNLARKRPIVVKEDLTHAFSGAVALVSAITGNHIHIGNAGDSRAILCSHVSNEEGKELIDRLSTSSDDVSGLGVHYRDLHRVQNQGNHIGATVVFKHGNKYFMAKQLSRDHTGDDQREVEILKSAHPNEPNVIKHGRVKGRLQPTRGIGDGLYKMRRFFDFLPDSFPYKPKEPWNPPYTTAEPETISHELGQKDLFLVMGTDGLWDELSNEEVAKTVLNNIDSSSNTNTATVLIKAALTKVGKAICEDGEQKSEDDYLKSVLELEDINRRRDVHDDITTTVVYLSHT